MSIGVTEKHVLYDNPCAPIVKFSHSNEHDDTDEEEDMTDDQSTFNSTKETVLNLTLGE